VSNVGTGLSQLYYVTRRLISTQAESIQQFTLVKSRWHRRIRFTIHDVTVTFNVDR